MGVSPDGVGMRTIAAAFALAALALSAPATHAQAPVPHVGVILQGGPWYGVLEGLRAGLKDLNLIEGRHLVLEIRDTRGDLAAAQEAAQALENNKVAVIVAAATSVSVATKKGTRTTPIVYAGGTDPIAVGLVDSVRSPEGRITGVHFSVGDVTGKRIELLKEMVPHASRVMTFYDPRNSSAAESIKQGREAAAQLRMTLLERHVRTPAELDSAIQAFGPGEADGYIAVADAMVDSRTEALIAMAKRTNLPTIFYEEGIARQGALASYGTDFREVGRAAAKYVQRILNGERPGDLPIERLTALSFVLNLTTAQQIGLTLPNNALTRADKLLD